MLIRTPTSHDDDEHNMNCVCISPIHLLSRQRIAVLPAYQSVLEFGRERPDAILLDIGACYESLTNIPITWI